LGKKRHKGKKKGLRHTPLARMKKRGSTLIAPMSELNMRPLSWDRDLLPEHLWIAALAETFGVNSFHNAYERFLDAIDSYWPSERKEVCLGLLSDFETIPVDARAQFLSEHRALARSHFWEPIGEALSLYPECPAKWLCDGLRDEGDGALDPERGLARLRGLLKRLLGGRSEFATRVRVVPFARPLKHGKMFFMKGMETVELLPKYPDHLNPDEKARVESFVRASMMSLFAMREDLEDHRWPQYFWRKNYELALCKPVERAVPNGMIATDATELSELQRQMDTAATQVRAYVQDLQRKVPIDIYDPSKDEILLGLFARASRLLVLLFEDPYLWARDVGAILLRCLADTAITFIYLAKKGTKDDFARFVAYGEGQLKLLMLHLQDNYPEGHSPEGASGEDLESSFTTMPEFIDIELGHWAGKDARRLAADVGLERLYRLVFTPASSDVHGTWLALARSHLTYCNESLHRFHRLPDITEPPFFVSVVDTARELYEECRSAGVSALHYPTAQPLPLLVETPPQP
jgi:hypothetical protein